MWSFLSEPYFALFSFPTYANELGRATFKYVFFMLEKQLACFSKIK